MFNEIWKPITDYIEYEVSSFGRVRRILTSVTKQPVNRLLKPYPDKGGYLRVELWKSGKSKQVYVHRLVATAYLPLPYKDQTEVNHKNFIVYDNSLNNLEWVTPLENKIYGQGGIVALWEIICKQNNNPADYAI